MENPTIFIKRELYMPIILEFKKILPHASKEETQKTIHKLFQTVGELALNRLQTFRNIERESAIAKYMCASLSILRDINLSKNEKIFQLNSLNENIMELIKGFSPILKGVKEGLEESLNYGGLTTLLTLNLPFLIEPLRK